MQNEIRQAEKAGDTMKHHPWNVNEDSHEEEEKEEEEEKKRGAEAKS